MNFDTDNYVAIAIRNEDGIIFHILVHDEDIEDLKKRFDEMKKNLDPETDDYYDKIEELIEEQHGIIIEEWWI